MAVKSKAMADKSAPAPAKPAETAASAAASAPASAPASAVASAPAEAQPPVPKAKPVPLVKKPSPLEPTITDKINDHLGAIGIGIAALLAAVAALVVARRRKDAPPPPEAVAPVFEPEAPVAPPAGPAPEDQQSEASNHLFGAAAAAAGIGAVAGASVLEGTDESVSKIEALRGTARSGEQRRAPRSSRSTALNALRPPLLAAPRRSSQCLYLDRKSVV